MSKVAGGVAGILAAVARSPSVSRGTCAASLPTRLVRSTFALGSRNKFTGRSAVCALASEQKPISTVAIGAANAMKGRELRDMQNNCLLKWDEAASGERSILFERCQKRE